MGRSDTARLDAFTDAAFAFALTLLLIGGGDRVPETYADLLEVVRHIPAFAAGFALIAMFWHAHVRWRRVSTQASGAAVWLSLALVFLVLVYVYPLRMMMQSATEIAMGGRVPFSAREAANLFTIYGIGFATMAGLHVALFVTCLVDPNLSGEARLASQHEIVSATILMTSGILSAILAQTAAYEFAPYVYCLIPFAIAVQLYVARRRAVIGMLPSPN